MKVFVLGLDGATWDLLKPLADAGELPKLASLMGSGASGTLHSVFPPLSPVAWTGVMTGKNSGKHGVFEFLEYGHDPLKGKVNSSRAIQSELVWEIAGRHGKTTVAGGVPMSYPPAPRRGSSSGISSARRTRPTSPATRRSWPSWRRPSGRIAPGRRPSTTAGARPRRSTS